MQKFDIGLPEPLVCIKKEGNKGVFEIRNCWPGYGMTIGNSLRRVILSSLEGAAITTVKFSDVSHEFSTIPYVIEDVVAIILNLKQIRFKMHTDGPEKLTLKVNGERVVTAADIKSNSNVEVVNEDAPIATLTGKNAKFEMEIQIERGIGYMPVEARKDSKLDIGNIAIDAIFTPIRRVSYKVENMRVGKRTDFNKIIFSIETDGSVSPEDALRQSVAILVEQFKSLTRATAETVEGLDLIEAAEPEKAEEEEKKQEKSATTEKHEDKSLRTEEEKSADALEIKIEEMKLPTRVQNALRTASIRTVAGLLKKNYEDLLGLEGLGEKGVKEIKKELGKLGLTLKQ